MHRCHQCFRNVGSPRSHLSILKIYKQNKKASRFWDLILEPHSLPWGIPRLLQGGQRLILCERYVDFTMSPESSLDASWSPLGRKRAPLRTPLQTPRLQSCALVHARRTFSLKSAILRQVFAHSEARGSPLRSSRLPKSTMRTLCLSSGDLRGVPAALMRTPWSSLENPRIALYPSEVLWTLPQVRKRPHLAPKVLQHVSTWTKKSLIFNSSEAIPYPHPHPHPPPQLPRSKPKHCLRMRR